MNLQNVDTLCHFTQNSMLHTGISFKVLNFPFLKKLQNTWIFACITSISESYLGYIKCVLLCKFKSCHWSILRPYRNTGPCSRCWARREAESVDITPAVLTGITSQPSIKSYGHLDIKIICTLPSVFEPIPHTKKCLIFAEKNQLWIMDVKSCQADRIWEKKAQQAS